LQALLEASRQVHSTIREEEVLEQVLRIVVRELEMAGAAFPGTGLAYGDAPRARRCQRDGASALASIRWTTATATAHDGAGGGASRRPRADALRGRLHRRAGVAGRRGSGKRPQPQAQRGVCPRAAGSGRGPPAIQRSLLAAEAARDSRLLAGLPLRHLLRGGRRLSRHCGAARRQPADGRGRCGRQGAGFGHHVHQLPLGLSGMAATGRRWTSWPRA
jgi:hypothetical protein